MDHVCVGRYAYNMGCVFKAFSLAIKTTLPFHVNCNKVRCGIATTCFTSQPKWELPGKMRPITLCTAESFYQGQVQCLQSCEDAAACPSSPVSPTALTEGPEALWLVFGGVVRYFSMVRHLDEGKISLRVRALVKEVCNQGVWSAGF